MTYQDIGQGSIDQENRIVDKVTSDFIIIVTN